MSNALLERLKSGVAKAMTPPAAKSKGGHRPLNPERAARKFVRSLIGLSEEEQTAKSLEFLQSLPEDQAEAVVAAVEAIKRVNVQSSGDKKPSIGSYENLLNFRAKLDNLGMKSVEGNEHDILQKMYPNAGKDISALRAAAEADAIRLSSFSVSSNVEGDKRYNKTFAEALKLVGFEFARNGAVMHFTVRGRIKPKPEGFGQRGRKAAQ